jgi:co-chaperonin GroES (HSP10)
LLKFKGDNLKPGDIIIFTRHEGKRFKFEGETYLKLKQKWVLGKLDKG